MQNLLVDSKLVLVITTFIKLSLIDHSLYLD